MVNWALIAGLTVPLCGTVIGASCVFLMRDSMPVRLQKTLLGFASGVMIAASVWSLLIPAMEMSSDASRWGQLMPAAVGFILGMAFLYVIDMITPHIHPDGNVEGPRSRLSNTKKLALAVTIHNIPEGMAVGVTLAAVMEQSAYVSLMSSLALTIGIAIQNIPEGAIVSMPLRVAGGSHRKAFLIGAGSGAVEPLAAIVTVLLCSWILPVLPYLLAFAAGAMLYVVVEEIIPETAEGPHSNLGTIGFAFGFLLMMVLDVALG